MPSRLRCTSSFSVGTAIEQGCQHAFVTDASGNQHERRETVPGSRVHGGANIGQLSVDGIADLVAVREGQVQGRCRGRDADSL